MKRSTKGRYAVMAMVDLATQTAQQKPIALADIAERQEISLSYLEQLFGKLRKGGMVRSVRGPGGGYLLARSAADTCVSDIVKSVDEQIKATRCKPGTSDGCHSNKSLCLTHDLWEELGNQIHQFLSSVSLEDIVDKKIPGSGSQFFDNVDNRSQFMVT
jgi:Rrf2 family iron-sulfur cluster assembly transcriptional regulator